MKSLIGIDWLSFSGYFAPEKEMQTRTAEFVAEKRKYGTRNFSEVWDVYYFFAIPGKVQKAMKPFCSLACKPQSAILNERLVTFKMDNALLYTDNWFLMLMLFLSDFHLISVKLQRIDLFRDFQSMNYFGKEVAPQAFLTDIANGKLQKKNATKFSLFADARENGVYAVTYGSIISGRQLAIYNKTKELVEVHDKPYIRQAWKSVGFDKEKPVFRAEVRICKKGLTMFDQEIQERTDLDIKKLYEYKIEPVINGYFQAVAVWFTSNGKTISPFTSHQDDDLYFPFIPKYLKKITLPNPKNQAKNVLRWSESIEADIKNYPYISMWHERTLNILKDFIWLLRETIPLDKELPENIWYDNDYHRWVYDKTLNIRNYVRQNKPYIIPEDVLQMYEDTTRDVEQL